VRPTRVAIAVLLAAVALGGAGTAFAQEAAPAVSPAQQQAERQQVQPLNNAPVWREVRSEGDFYTSIKGRETGVLIQSAGETWREARVPLAIVGGVLVLLAVAVLFVFYRLKGPIGTHAKPTGRTIRRFSTIQRVTHWTMGGSFAILGLTGLVVTFGKYILLPVIGYTLFSWLAALAKALHNFVGPVFLVSVPVFIVVYVRDNLPSADDIKWLLKFGGLLSGEHVPSGRFNAGEKGMFWFLVCVVGVVLAVTGVILDFPNFDQTRSTMQLTNMIHMGTALLGISIAAFHIYLGTVGVKGAYEAMRYGYVDETWAKEHHALWYEEVKSGKAREPFEQPPVEAAQRVQAASQHG